MTVEEEKLEVRWGRFTFRLEHYHFDTFTAIPVAPKDEVVSFDRSTFDVQFRLGTNGESRRDEVLGPRLQAGEEVGGGRGIMSE